MWFPCLFSIELDKYQKQSKEELEETKKVKQNIVPNLKQKAHLVKFS